MKKHQKSWTAFQSFLFTAFIGILSTTVYSQQPQTSTPSDFYPPATVPDSEVRTLYSKILNQEMNIFIKLPMLYKINGDKKYPCWYVTDANRSFPMLANIGSVFEVPDPSQGEMIIVGIGYKIRDVADWAAYRTKDLTPINDPGVDGYYNKFLNQATGRQFDIRSGGANKLLEFIATELIPFVESNYRVSLTDRYLGGYSYGGLFTLYSMLSKPNLFIKYFAGSPSIDFGNGFLFDLENSFASSHKDIRAKLWMTAGGAEDSITIANVKRMTNTLRSRNYPGFSVESYIFPEETHQSSMAVSLMRGFVVLNKR
jgi:predicted alpha/beta superfamily hydrolase